MTARDTLTRFMRRWRGAQQETPPPDSPAPSYEPLFPLASAAPAQDEPPQPEPDIPVAQTPEPVIAETVPPPAPQTPQPIQPEPPRLETPAPEPAPAEPADPWPSSRFYPDDYPGGTARTAPAAPAAPAWTPPDPAPTPPAITLGVHIGGIGDRGTDAFGWAGHPANARRLEGFILTSPMPDWAERVTCQAVAPDKSLGPMSAGGLYCGTRGKNQPLHGFVLHRAPHTPALAALRYRGIFEDGFRSPFLAPGARCVSPGHAALVAMQISTDVSSAEDLPAQAPPLKQEAAPPPVAAAPLVRNPARPAPKPAAASAPHALDESFPNLSLLAHIAGRGDTPADEEGWCGDPATGRRIEGFAAAHAVPFWKRDVTYQAVLADGSLGPETPGGTYCGTRGKNQPLHGFVLKIAGNRPDLAGITYEAVFQDGARTPELTPGQLCVSPSRAALLAMRIRFTPPETASSGPPENIRLVIWDLDECFWGGTLTEGGIFWREENAQTVRALAGRGIISSICSKNDPDDVFAVLDQHGMRDHFVFPSISWQPKGPRLAELVSSVQLRAQSILFIDDNPMNRAEAARFVPGLQVADETTIPALLENPLLAGKPDPELTRLAQYRLLERRQNDRQTAGGDTTAFLRESKIVVTIEHDLEPHLDRAIELINRTNQLNFTKTRLAEDHDDPEVARSELRTLLARFNVQAGLLHVRDRYGDYGYCGIYVTLREPAGGPRLLHFAFSCRILGMGIETWLYRTLEKPRLQVVGRVLADVFDDRAKIDWISTELPEIGNIEAEAGKPLRYVLARGACDMRAVSHYFTTIADRVIEEFDTARNGQTPLLNHSLMVTQRLQGLADEAIADFAPFGFLPEDFATAIADGLPPGPGVWLLGFGIEQPVPIYRHRATGALLPASVIGLPGHAGAMAPDGPSGQADPALVAHLREKFTYFGRRPDGRVDTLFRESLHQIFSRAPGDVRIFVLLSNTATRNGNAQPFHSHNEKIKDVAKDYANVELLDPQAFMTAEELAALSSAHHFDRIVYFRIFRHIAQSLKK